MPRSVLLCSTSWADLPLAELSAQAAEWGYQGLELCCWGDHFEVQRALSEEGYTSSKLEELRRVEMEVPVLSNHRVSLAVCDVIDDRHRRLLPDYVWGDGSPAGVQQRATEEMIATVRAAHKLGVGVLAGFTGSPIWSYVAGYPPVTPELVVEALREFVHRWSPILEACQEYGIRYAFEVRPGQIAFDLYSAEIVLDALNAREEFGFTLAPAHLHWQGVDPVEFIRRFHDRIYHVHVEDVAITLNGRSGLLGSYFGSEDPRRGWHPRSPGRGSLDWEGIIRALNAAGYDGTLAVDWEDPGMDRACGAEEACKWVKRLDFEPPPRSGSQTFI
jgi:sugar phosphate isomerase/epimerase